MIDWVDINDHKPPRKKVLFCIDGSDVDIGVAVISDTGESTLYICGFDKNLRANVTHWAELPAGPK